MYFIDKPEELHGKTIAYVNMNKFAENILISTTDGGILIVTQHSDEFDSEIEICNKETTKYFILNSKKIRRYIYDDLIKYGVFTEEEYNQLTNEENKKKKEQEEKRKEEQKQAELEQYLKLKEKYKDLKI